MSDPNALPRGLPVAGSVVEREVKGNEKAILLANFFGLHQSDFPEVDFADGKKVKVDRKSVV